MPFYLRTGKRLPKRVSEIAIHFHRTPHLLFRRGDGRRVEPNVLVIRIQPDEGISLHRRRQGAGTELKHRPVTLDFRYREVFGAEPPEAYERLLLDAMLGDSTLFSRGDWIEQAWRLTEPMLDHWARRPGPCPSTRPAPGAPRSRRVHRPRRREVAAALAQRRRP